MLVLHASRGGSALLLWAETALEAPLRPSGRLRSSRAAGPPPAVEAHPFSAGAEAVAAALAGAGLGRVASGSPASAAVARLPSRGGCPLPSGPLVGPEPSSRAEPAVAPFRVEALDLAPAEALELLCAAAGKSVLAPGVAVGPDLSFWAAALRLAGALVARQRVLPGLSKRGGGWRARWEPVFLGPDADRLAALARALPPAALALARPPLPRAAGDDGPPVDPPEPGPEAGGALEALKGFLADMTDHLVRSASGDGAPAPLPAAPRKAPGAPAVHDAWMAALRGDDGAVAGDEAELARLAAQALEWRRPVELAASSPVRLCFRVEEPSGPTAAEAAVAGARAPWFVRYLLQPLGHSSLLVPLADAWGGRGLKGSLLGTLGMQSGEYLLSALGQAAGICPEVEASLRSPRPAGFALDAAGAHDFLSRTALALENAGFGVLLPAWWTRRGARERLTVSAVVPSPLRQGKPGLSLDRVVKFDWRVALGGEAVSREDLEALARMKEPLVKFRGRWVEVSPREIQAALEFLRKRESGEGTVRDVVGMALGTETEAGGLALEGVEAAGWIGDLLAKLGGGAALEELPVPAGFRGTLRPYQARGYSWLAFLRRFGLGACLADDMGLGKTVQTLALLLLDRESGARDPVLLVCPTSVVRNWQKEAERFAPGLRVLVHHGPGRARGEAFAREASRHDLVLSSYALLSRDEEDLKRVRWSGAILDEAQNIKNPDTRQSRAARALPAGFRAALTGTPVENGVGDLWAIMEFLNPGLLGSQAEFHRAFFVPIQAGRDREAASRLKRIVGPFILRRLKTDRSVVSDLPEKMEMKVYCPLTAEQATLYAAVLRDLEAEMRDAEGIRRRGIILAALSKLKQVCNHPAQFLGDGSRIPGRSGKVARLTEMLEEAIGAGDRSLVFTQFAEMGEILRRHLEETFGREVPFLHGGVPRTARDRMIDRFQAADGPAVFLLSLKAGGTGLNLTRANRVFHFDRWWNPAVEDQATDRAFRIGQTRNVQVHKFVCSGTLEERIDGMIEGKKTLAASVVGAGEGWITELSDSELREVFALREEALAE
ncbi:MAG: DEAD/DEAH box helicase [Planctomycetes bacterium]|jgi:hypothetical protein|nr:DEAD/DEAH box helicase [Planctomycetota bacterium]